LQQTESFAENIQEELRELREIVQTTSAGRSATADLCRQVHEMRSRISTLSLRMRTKSSSNVLRAAQEEAANQSASFKSHARKVTNLEEDSSQTGNEIVAAPLIVDQIPVSYVNLSKLVCVLT